MTSHSNTPLDGSETAKVWMYFIIVFLTIFAWGIAFSSQDFILECKEGEDGISNVILMQPSIEQAQWVSMQKPESGNIYIEDNLYEVVFIARYDTTVFKINRYTGTFTRESGTPPFGVMKQDNQLYVGHCQSRDASPRF